MDEPRIRKLDRRSPKSCRMDIAVKGKSGGDKAQAIHADSVYVAERVASSGQSLTDTTHLRPSYRSAAGGFTRPPPPSASSTTLFPPSHLPSSSLCPTLSLSLSFSTPCSEPYNPLSLPLSSSYSRCSSPGEKERRTCLCRAPHHENEFLVHHLFFSFSSFSTDNHLVLASLHPRASRFYRTPRHLRVREGKRKRRWSGAERKRANNASLRLHAFATQPRQLCASHRHCSRFDLKTSCHFNAPRANRDIVQRPVRSITNNAKILYDFSLGFGRLKRL